MVPILNDLGTNVACVGVSTCPFLLSTKMSSFSDHTLQNHDLDFGVTQFRHLRNQCTFPWLLANVLDPALGKDVALAECPKTAMLESSTGIKVGVIGLAEREW